MANSPVSLRVRFTEMTVVLLIVAALGAILRPVFVEASGDRNRVCAENTKSLVGAVRSYIQDYDEVFPYVAIWSSPVAFKREISPYLDNTSVFRCPSTASGYTPNPALAGVSEASLTVDRENTEVLRDSKAHPDGKLTIVYLDGTVERGGVEQFIPSVDAVCVDHLAYFSLAILQYVQDYDEKFPPATDDNAYRSLLNPYIRSRRDWACPDTRIFYYIDTKFRGKSQAAVEDVRTWPLLKDTRIHRNRAITTAFVDGHVEQISPRGILYPHSELATSSTSRLKQLSLGMLQYAQDYDERLPPLDSLRHFRTATFPYLRLNEVYIAPGPSPFTFNSDISYMPLSTIPKPAETWTIYDYNNYNDGKFGIAYVDGHVKRGY